MWRNRKLKRDDVSDGGDMRTSGLAEASAENPEVKTRRSRRQVDVSDSDVITFGSV